MGIGLPSIEMLGAEIVLPPTGSWGGLRSGEGRRVLR